MSYPTVADLFEHFGDAVDYNIQNYSKGQWHCTPYFSKECGDAVCEASNTASAGYHKGKIRVIDRDEKEIIRFYEGGGIDHDCS